MFLRRKDSNIAVCHGECFKCVSRLVSNYQIIGWKSNPPFCIRFLGKYYSTYVDNNPSHVKDEFMRLLNCRAKVLS